MPIRICRKTAVHGWHCCGGLLHSTKLASLVDGFECGEPALDDWLKRRAMANQLSGASRTFVVVNPQNRVYGYYAMTAGAVAHQTATSTVRRDMPAPVPVMVLARLAVHRQAQGI